MDYFGTEREAKPLIFPSNFNGIVAVISSEFLKNLMLFGLKEEKGELLCDKIGQVLLELGEKPKIEASRIGLNKPKDKKKVADRPVKVTLTSSTIVQQILTIARHLRSSELFGKVFISPDR